MVDTFSNDVDRFLMMRRLNLPNSQLAKSDVESMLILRLALSISL